MDPARRFCCITFAVSHQANRCTVLVKPAQKRHDTFPIFRVEIAGGFIGQKNYRITGHRPRHRSGLLFSTSRCVSI